MPSLYGSGEGKLDRKKIAIRKISSSRKRTRIQGKILGLFVAEKNRFVKNLEGRKKIIIDVKYSELSLDTKEMDAGEHVPYCKSFLFSVKFSSVRYYSIWIFRS